MLNNNRAWSSTRSWWQWTGGTTTGDDTHTAAYPSIHPPIHPSTCPSIHPPTSLQTHTHIISPKLTTNPPPTSLQTRTHIISPKLTTNPPPTTQAPPKLTTNHQSPTTIQAARLPDPHTLFTPNRRIPTPPLNHPSPPPHTQISTHNYPGSSPSRLWRPGAART